MQEPRAERPNVMRAEVVDKYITSVLDEGAQMAIQNEKGDPSKNWVKIVE